MSEYFNFDLDAFLAPDDQEFDFSFLDDANPIGQGEAVGYDYNTTYGFDPAMDFAVDPTFDIDFNAGFQHGSSLPVLPDATGTIDQFPCPSTVSVRQDQSTKPNQETYSHVCRVCHQSFDSDWSLSEHAKYEMHPTLECGHSGCSNLFTYRYTRDQHQRTPHLPSHREVHDDSFIKCAECNETFQCDRELADHVRNTKHSPLACSCGVTFARRDVLIRHLNSYTKAAAQYECTLCRRYRGKQAFRRRDHLVQHLQGYHKMEPEEINSISPPKSRLRSRQILICPHVNCEAHRDDAFTALPWAKQYEGKPFQKQSDYNKHMRDVHQESAFSCSVAGCDRVGARGYMREKDLMKHRADKHPEAPSYVYFRPEPLRYRCEICGNGFKTTSILDDHQRRSNRCRSLRNDLNAELS